MPRLPEDTLSGVLDRLPSDDRRGVRFLEADYDGRFYSYPQLREDAYRVAGALREVGVQRGERVALVLPEHESFLFGFLGLSLLGAVAVPMASRSGSNPRNRASYQATIVHVLRAAQARYMLCSADNREALEEALTGAGLDVTVISIEALRASTASPTQPLALAPSDLCFIQFTSGSTSMPKGVMVTHQNLVANARAFLGPRGSIARRESDLALGWLPFFHDMGLVCFALGPLVVNLPTVLLPTDVFARRPWSWMTAMSRHAATVTFAPNFAYELAAKLTRARDLEHLDLSPVRVAGCGAEPINAEVLRRFCERFGPAGLKPEAMVPCYGMAEATVAISFHPAGKPTVVERVDADALRAGRALPATPESHEVLELVSCGRAVEGHQVKVVNELGNEASERDVGEICFAGASVTLGYYRHPDATAEVYKAGWLHTGDLGYVSDGNLYVCGRLKDVIIVHGANYYPQDIEWAVQEVCQAQPNRVVAFSVLRDSREFVVVCVESPKGGRSVSEVKRQVTEAVEQRVGIRVHHVAILERGELTLTSSGKVQRRKTKQLFESGELRERRELDAAG